MNKVKVENFRNIHYYAQCEKCGFDVGISSSVTAEGLRNKVRSHVLKTGHTVNLESGSSATYSLNDE